MTDDAPVLVINSGSSSVKYQVVRPSGERLATGLVERIGEGGGSWRHDGDGERAEGSDSLTDHQAAFDLIKGLFDEHGPALDGVGLQAVGHRVVHGGARFSEPTVITDEVLSAVDELSALAPLHNPPAAAGIRAARHMLPDLMHVAVFDTAFFAALPAAAATYAIPARLTRDHGIRRYGFHGTSHDYVSHRAAATLGRDYAELNQIVLHLGNGCSASAISHGVAVDTSMGLTPLEGLVMGTRSGDLDPGLHGYLASTLGMSLAEVTAMLNTESGLKGLAGANDFREISRRREAGDQDAALAFDVYVHRIRRYVGAYLVTLGRLDALVFTAGVGENSAVLRAAVTAGLGGLGITLDPDLNAGVGSGSRGDAGARVVSSASSRTAVLVVPTDEELAIAKAAASLAPVGD